MNLPVEFLERLVELGKSLPQGPWATPRDAGKLFGRRHTDWGEVYASVFDADIGETIDGCPILQTNVNLVTKGERLAARKEHDPNPGLPGRIAEYVAMLAPGMTTAMCREILSLRRENERLRKR